MIPLTEGNIRFFEEYLPKAALSNLKEEGCFGYGLADGDLVSGAVFVTENREESIAEILQLYVDEEVRRNGGGSIMLREVLKTAIMHGMTALAVRYDYPGDADLQTFLLSKGFRVYDPQKGDRYALLSLASRNEPEFKTGDDSLLMGNMEALSAVPMLNTVEGYLSERGFESEFCYPEGDLPPVLSVETEDLSGRVFIGMKLLSAESNVSSLTFSYYLQIPEDAKKTIREKAGMWQEEHDGINLMPDEENTELTFLMGVLPESGTPAEEEFFDHFAQFVGEVQTFSING